MVTRRVSCSYTSVLFILIWCLIFKDIFIHQILDNSSDRCLNYFYVAKSHSQTCFINMKNKVSLLTPNKSSKSSNFQFGCAIVVMSKQAMASAILSLLHRYLLLALDGDIHLNPGPVSAQNLVSSPQGNSCFNLPSRGLRIGQWNINRLNETKFEQVQIEILGHDYNEKRLDILIINKTFLNSQTSTELFNIPGFDLYIRNRNSTSKTLNGGGIAIYVNRDLIAK